MRIPVDVAPLTITLNEQKACNPLESVAVYVTVREPKEKEAPESKSEIKHRKPSIICSRWLYPRHCLQLRLPQEVLQTDLKGKLLITGGTVSPVF